MAESKTRTSTTRSTGTRRTSSTSRSTRSTTRSTTARTPSTTGKATARTPSTTRKDATKRSTTGKKAAQTRAANRGAAARAKVEREVAREVKSPVERVGHVAERAVLVQVGAALVARDTLVSTIGDIRDTYSSRAKAQRRLRTFERRGVTARNHLEREVKKTRTRVERELRKRRNRVQREVRSFAKDIDRRSEPARRNAELVGARVENAVQGGLTSATQASARVSEAVATLT